MFPDDEGNAPAVAVGRLSGPPLSRRQFMQIAGVAGFAAAALDLGLRDGYAFAAGSGGTSSLGSGTVPEQIHLTWGANPATEVTVSWASPQPEVTPQVMLSPAVGGQTVFGATMLTYTDGLSGEVVNCYHVPLSGLTPATTYSYTVADAATPGVTFSSSFTTTSTGRFSFAFTSFGDLGTPGAGATYTLANGTTISSSTYSESQWNAYNAVGEVEVLTPLFHLLNGDLCYGDKETINSSGQTTTGISNVQPAPEVWRDFALNLQRSAANRPWMPCLGNHEAELDNGTYGYNSYLTRFKLPGNGTAFPGSFYSFQVGSVLFISLDANDVCYQGAGAYNVGFVATTDAEGNPISTADYVYNQFYTGTFTSNSNGTLSPGGTTPNVQTQWLESTLAAARASTSVDWIVVQMHQSALSSSTDNGCDAGIRQAWVPLFDQYQVDLVLNGHDHDYERSFPVRGFAPAPYPGTSTWKGSANTAWPSDYVYNTSGPTSVTPNSGATVNTFTPVVAPGEGTGSVSSPFNTTLGTVYMVLGGGGTNKRDNAYNSGTANVTTFTQIRVGTAFDGIAAGTKPLSDASEPCTWSANKDTTDAYGIALFSIDPGEQGGNTTMTVTYYHAPTQSSGTPNYSVYDTFYLTRPRSDNPPAATPEFPMPAYVVGGTAALAGGALLVRQHRQSKKAERQAELAELSAPAQG
jgi:Purple acid Phosphatase, N-terminal domain/Calcineurin-like phosphoesterase